MGTNWRKARLILGPLLALLGGGAVSALPDWLTRTLGLLNSPGQPYIPMATIALALLVAGVGAWLLRSWWSALLVPALFFAGYMLGALLDLNLVGSAYDTGYFTLALVVFAVIFLTPLALITLLATAMSKRFAQSARAQPA
jgi:hypothetical protein